MDIAPSNDPLIWLTSVMQDDSADMKLRLDAAKAIIPFVHTRADTAKKPQAAAAAKKASTGKFAASAPPLRVVS
jgi:phage terminase small subunit